MWCAAGMNINRRAKLRETPSGASVIEMDVAEENMPHIFGVEAHFSEFGGDILES